MQHQNKYIHTDSTAEIKHHRQKTLWINYSKAHTKTQHTKNTAHHKQNTSKTEHNTNKIAMYSPAKEKNTTDKIRHITRERKLQIKQSMAQKRKNKYIYIPLQKKKKKKARAEYLYLLCLRPSGSKYNASAINYFFFFYALTLIFFKGQKIDKSMV